uniref:Uncharacterized protein n=1 Tax=Magnetospirillum gryphiswaldense TaxID=55518 RepID=Q3BKC9_9PROT|nr:hypothetical protein mgI463 [Magnetospirillum gryphiswaldense MSR-1]
MPSLKQARRRPQPALCDSSDNHIGRRRKPIRQRREERDPKHRGQAPAPGTPPCRPARCCRQQRQRPEGRQLRHRRQGRFRQLPRCP